VSERDGAVEDGKRRKKKMTSGTCMSVIKERGCNEVYVFTYTCSWSKSSPYIFSGIFVGSEEL